MQPRSDYPDVAGTASFNNKPSHSHSRPLRGGTTLASALDWRLLQGRVRCETRWNAPCKIKPRPTSIPLSSRLGSISRRHRTLPLHQKKKTFCRPLSWDHTTLTLPWQLPVPYKPDCARKLPNYTTFITHTCSSAAGPMPLHISETPALHPMPTIVKQ